MKMIPYCYGLFVVPGNVELCVVEFGDLGRNGKCPQKIRLCFVCLLMMAFVLVHYYK